MSTAADHSEASQPQPVPRTAAAVCQRSRIDIDASQLPSTDWEGVSDTALTIVRAADASGPHGQVKRGAAAVEAGTRDDAAVRDNLHFRISFAPSVGNDGEATGVHRLPNEPATEFAIVAEGLTLDKDEFRHLADTVCPAIGELAGLAQARAAHGGGVLVDMRIGVKLIPQLGESDVLAG